MNEPVREIRGRWLAIPADNIDTDAIIAAQHLKATSRAGLGAHAFGALRSDPGNPIDEGLERGASILVAGDNFGCGSSREHAVWALLDLGIRAVIATGFSDIFKSNAFKNGLVAACVESTGLAEFLDCVGNRELSIDLARLTISVGDRVEISIRLDPFHRECLMKGIDEIELTFARESEIAAYERRSALLSFASSRAAIDQAS